MPRALRHALLTPQTSPSCRVHWTGRLPAGGAVGEVWLSAWQRAARRACRRGVCALTNGRFPERTVGATFSSSRAVPFTPAALVLRAAALSHEPRWPHGGQYQDQQEEQLLPKAASGHARRATSRALLCHTGRLEVLAVRVFELLTSAEGVRQIVAFVITGKRHWEKRTPPTGVGAPTLAGSHQGHTLVLSPDLALTAWQSVC